MKEKKERKKEEEWEKEKKRKILKREKIWGDGFTWMDLTAQTKAVKHERTMYEWTLGGRIHLEGRTALKSQ